MHRLATIHNATDNDDRRQTVFETIKTVERITALIRGCPSN